MKKDIDVFWRLHFNSLSTCYLVSIITGCIINKVFEGKKNWTNRVILMQWFCFNGFDTRYSLKNLLFVHLSLLLDVLHILNNDRSEWGMKTFWMISVVCKCFYSFEYNCFRKLQMRFLSFSLFVLIFHLLHGLINQRANISLWLFWEEAVCNNFIFRLNFLFFFVDVWNNLDKDNDRSQSIHKAVWMNRKSFKVQLISHGFHYSKLIVFKIKKRIFCKLFVVFFVYLLPIIIKNWSHFFYRRTN